MISLVDEIRLTETGLLPPLVADYIAGNEKTKLLYKYQPQLKSFADAIKDKEKDAINRALLVEVLEEQYVNIPASESVKQNIKLLGEANTFTVTAAHQPCLFMGPLYNVYKISCAVSLSIELKKEYPAYNFVPVFWMGSEDHDMEELNHVAVDGNTLAWQGGSGAVGRLDTALIAPVVESLKAQIGETEIIQILQAGLRDYNSFGKLTQYFVNELFKAHGLVVIDQDDKKLKQCFIAVIKDEIFNKRAASVLKETIDYLDANYKAQAKPRDINFFYLGDGFRERIIADEAGGFKINNQNISFTRDELEKEVEQSPERFSPNVIYRPLFQEMVLPNLCFIGGSGELSYWLELKPLFDYHKVNFPVLMPRNSAAILSSGIQSKMQKAGLTAGSLFQNPEHFIAAKIKAQSDGALSLAEQKKELEALYDKLTEKAEAVDATLKQSAMGEKQKALNALDALEGKMLKAEKRKQETFSNQVYAVNEALFPKQSLQERVESFIPYYDTGFIDSLVKTLNPLDFKFRFFLFERPAN